MIGYFEPVPVWQARTTEALLYGPYIALALIGKPRWVKYVLFVHLALLAYLFVKVAVFNMGSGVAGVGAIVAIPILTLFLVSGAAISRFIAQLSNQYLWNRTKVSAEEPRDS